MCPNSSIVKRLLAILLLVVSVGVGADEKYCYDPEMERGLITFGNCHFVEKEVTKEIYDRLKVCNFSQQCATLVVVHRGYECRQHGYNFGELSTVAQCLALAARRPTACTPAVMVSTPYPSWGCRCCAGHTANDLAGPAHPLWDIYAWGGRKPAD